MALKPKKPPSRAMVAFSVVVFVLLLAFPVFIFGIAPPLERNVTTTWRCEVTSAEPRESSGGLRGSSTLPSVLLHTVECGDVVLQRGVTFDDMDAVAADFEPGAYDFEVGWVSAHLMTLIPNGLPEVRSYRPAP